MSHMELLEGVWLKPIFELKFENKLTSLDATLVGNYDPASYPLTGVRCKATSVAKKQARKLQATLVRNYDWPTYLLTYFLTGVRCKATSVAKIIWIQN